MASVERALILVAMVAAAAVLETAAATTYTVGAPDGLWDLQTNYAEWVATKTFHPGDKITFTYSAELHDVVEVSKAGYDACSSANNVSAFRTGNDVVPLTAVGTRYFLCGLTGHCGSGMKIRIDVVAAGSSPISPAAAPTSAAAPSASTAAGTAVLGFAVLLVVVLHRAIAVPLW
uniref:Phytocyanin domain-containing protein n=1 Tax=Arundo donax TaxID=35708 RepID=A0A0A9E5U1_ARUDO